MRSGKKDNAGDLMKDESDIIKDMVAKKKGKKGRRDSKHKEKGEKILQHKHCIICYRAIQLGKDYCSEICELTHQTKIKKQKRMLYIMYGALALVFIAVMVTNF